MTDMPVASSSRGPTFEQRTKPDVTSPGASVRSAHYQAGNSGVDACATTVLSGTSMAAPGVAGAAALIRQYFESGFYPSGSATSVDRRNPSGALVKAMLINSGKPSDLAFWTSGSNTFLKPATSDDQGFNGRVQLDNVLLFSSNPVKLFVLESSVRTRAVETVCLRVVASALSHLRVCFFPPP
eukprot:TRINITY_DN11571_c0_g1_i4.p1 TRINITY_DN11571_c0_g1~~TRINITY_DN11571_c0_g1_i4.p1  ORF type:complete len:183 (+),score=25.90 TRINITY_DN11571_c0_g1_i4:717-1265(+)